MTGREGEELERLQELRGHGSSDEGTITQGGLVNRDGVRGFVPLLGDGSSATGSKRPTGAVIAELTPAEV